jgi:hypothetical protein
MWRSRTAVERQSVYTVSYTQCCDGYALRGMYENITHCRHFDFSLLLLGYINIATMIVHRTRAYEYIAKL